MKATIRLGRIAGIDIGIHHTWLIAFALIAWSLAVGFFPYRYFGWGAATYWVAGVAGALLLFASVLLHELAHSFVALARGLTVSSITLFIFGGVSNLSTEARRPRDEFAIAIVGPLTSLALALLFGGLLLVGVGRRGPVEAVLSYLVLINTLLALFNMVPGFPLDGGRVLRSLLWRVTGDLGRATTISATVGQGMAWLLILWGAWQFFQGNLLSGIWTAFVGWFLYSAAAASRTQAGWQEGLGGIRVARIMDAAPETVTPDTTVEELVRDRFLRQGRRAAPVCLEGRLLGIVTLTDVKRVPQARWAFAQVSEVMTRPPLQTAGPDEDLHTAFRLLADHDLNQILVLRGGHVVGMLSRAGVMRYLKFSR